MNILLITIDTLRDDALGASGNAAASTPSIDRLAAAGIRFSQAHAHAVVTLPSHASILSGRYPFAHGVRENAGFRFPPDIDTLATVLKAQGYRTSAFVSAFPLDARFGLGRGFDVYDDQYGKGIDHSAFHVPERRGADTVAAALEWIGSAPTKGPGAAPWFAWVHVYEPHFPYQPPEPFATRHRTVPYLGEVAAADAALEPLLAPILLAGAEGKTLVAITGDHGEALGEHGEMTHGLFAYEGTLHVPLLLYAPQLLSPRAVDEPVRHVDVMPTLLDAVGVAVPAGIDGRSLLSMAVTGRAPAAPGYFESLSASLNRGWAPLYGVSRGSLKYIDLPIPELYDLAVDAGETQNLASSRPDAVRELQQLLASVRKADRGPARTPETANTREQLRSLGYVSGNATPKARFTAADDPKELIGLDRAIEEVVSRYQRGDLTGAIRSGEDIVRRRPNMPLSLEHLAFLYNQAGRHQAAAETIRRALALNPSAQDVAALAGAYLTEAGQSGDAVALLSAYVTKPDPDIDVLIAYGVALASAGRPQDAIAAFGRARTLDAANALPLVNIGTVYLMAGDRVRAATAFTEALQVDEGNARAHNALGVIAAETGRSADAVDHWSRAVALDPRDYETLYNLGELLVRTGRSAEARPYWERYVQLAPPALESRDIERVRQWLAAHPASVRP
jgi:arylsulfatase A-like enzyme/Tfp pilus assembly protein PilF